MSAADREAAGPPELRAGATLGAGTRVVVGCDHNGLGLKRSLLGHLSGRGVQVVHDVGCHEDGEVDYPPLCEDLCRRVATHEADWGLFVGGSGQGEVVVCNKVPGIRAGLGHTDLGTRVSRGHNAANVLVLGAKVLTPEQAVEMLDLWLGTPFKGGVHARRVHQILDLEARACASGGR